MDPRSKAGLKRECQKHGLSTSGKKVDLLKRLRALATSTPTLPSENDENDGDIDCVLAVSIPFSVPSDMISTARTELAAAAQNDQLQEEELTPEQTVIANPRARSFFAHMTAEIEALKQETRKQHQENQNQHQAMKDEFQLQLEKLAHATLGFREFRNRFISVYKRDVLRESGEDDRMYIHSGNVVVHGGNCKRDAELYSGHRPRHDHSVFEKLYGVRPETAINIDDFDTIALLDKHATIVADLKYIDSITPTFHTCFQNFVTALSAHGFPHGFLKAGYGPINEYWAFHQAATQVMESR